MDEQYQEWVESYYEAEAAAEEREYLRKADEAATNWAYDMDNRYSEAF